MVAFPWSNAAFFLLPCGFLELLGGVSSTWGQLRNPPLPVPKLPSLPLSVKLQNEARVKEEATNVMPGKGGNTFPGSRSREEDKKEEENLRRLE